MDMVDILDGLGFEVRDGRKQGHKIVFHEDRVYQDFSPKASPAVMAAILRSSRLCETDP